MTDTIKRELFDHCDPAQQFADAHRKGVADLALSLETDPRFATLSQVEKLEMCVAGLLTGVVGVAFAHIEDGGRDSLMESIEAFLPDARQQAEEIMENPPQ